MAVNYDFNVIEVGSAVNFRENINYNFSLIKGYFEGMEGTIQSLQNQVTQLIENPSGPDIILSATQPEGQKEGSYWFRIIT